MVIHCPHCQKVGDAPDTLPHGVKMLCRGCQTFFRFSAAQILEGVKNLLPGLVVAAS